MATYTVLATGEYTSASTGGKYRLFVDDVIPLDQAIDLGLPGAAAPAPTNPFSGEQAAWLADVHGADLTDAYVAADVVVTDAYVAADVVVTAAIPTSVNDAMLTQARTATADGTGTGTIAAGTDWVDVTSDDATKIIVLPAPTPGTVVALSNGATGYELRTSAPATVGINGGAAADAESAIPAATLVICVCRTATAWLCSNTATDGTVSATEVAA